MTSSVISNERKNDVIPTLEVPREISTGSSSSLHSATCPESPLHLTPERPRSHGSSPFSSPETRKRQSWRKTLFMKELGSLGNEIRRAKDSIRGSMESILNNCSSSRGSTDTGLGEEKRRIRIEVVSDRATGNGRRRGGAAAESDVDGKDWTDDISNDHNFSSSLLLTSLEDGMFTAKIALETIPFGNIIIRIRNYRLEIVLDKRELHGDRKVDDSHRITHPQLIGTIDVPIYVDTSTLHFRLDSESDVLQLEGAMKGYLNREHSVSAGDLRSMMKSHNFRKKMKAKTLTHSTNFVPSGSLDDSVKVKDAGKQHGLGCNDSWMDRFRSRAYTH